MPMICSEIIQCLEQLSPRDYACSWDNVGLLVGHREHAVKSVVVALDATDDVIEYAIEQQADLLVTHHPMIFSSMKQINDDDFIGRKILKLAENRIACYAMHTNFDIKGSMAELAGERMKLTRVMPLEVTRETDEECVGIGQVGDLAENMTLSECAQFVKEQFELSHVLVFGPQNDTVERVAISPGSGRSMVAEALKQNADVLITGDIGHHEGLDAVEQGLFIIDAGHYGLEHIFIDYIKDYLIDECKESLDVKCCHSGSPFRIL